MIDPERKAAGGMSMNPVDTGWKMFFDPLMWQAVVSTDSIGPLGFKVYNSGASASFASGGLASGRVGIFTFGGGSGAGHFTTISTEDDSVLLGGASYRFSCALKLGVVPDVTNDYIVGVGFSSGGATSNFHSSNDYALLGVKRSLNATNWVATTRDNGGTADVEDTGVAFDTNWVNLDVIVSASDIKYYINGTLVHTESGVYPDTTNMTPFFGATHVAGAEQNMMADWYAFGYKPDAALGAIAPWPF